jgi:hypothetical protein
VPEHFESCPLRVTPLPPGCSCGPAPFSRRNKKEPVKSTYPKCRRRFVQTGNSLRAHLGNKSSDRQPPFGVQACIRKDKPGGNGAATRTKGGCRSRCADISGASFSSPVRAEHVVSYIKPLQRLVCRGLGFPSVPLQTGSGWRGIGQRHPGVIAIVHTLKTLSGHIIGEWGNRFFCFPLFIPKPVPPSHRLWASSHTSIIMARTNIFLLTCRRSPFSF